MAGVGGVQVEGVVPSQLHAEHWGAGAGGIGREGDTDPVRLSRLAAAGGLAGPVLFTVAWAASSLRQAGHSAAAVQQAGCGPQPARSPGW
jgi:hypothetical protein